MTKKRHKIDQQKPAYQPVPPITRYCIVCSDKIVTKYDRQYFCVDADGGHSCWQHLLDAERHPQQQRRYHEALMRQEFKCWSCTKTDLRLNVLILTPRTLDVINADSVVASCRVCRAAYYKKVAAKPTTTAGPTKPAR